MIQIQNMRDFGGIVRDARKKRELTQVTVAEMAGVTMEWISRFETGRIDNPNLATVFQVLNALDIVIGVSEDFDNSPAMDFSDLEESVVEDPSYLSGPR